MTQLQIDYLVGQLQKVDDFLAFQEDYCHGEEGKECTEARRSINIVIEQIKLKTNE